MLEKIGWSVLALVHLPPFVALFAPSLISRLYGVSPADPNFALLHHRAALFGVVMIACVWAIFRDDMRDISAVLTGLSLCSFLAIYFSYGQPAVLKSIAVADIIALPFLFYVSYKAFIPAFGGSE